MLGTLLWLLVTLLVYYSTCIVIFFIIFNSIKVLLVFLHLWELSAALIFAYFIRKLPILSKLLLFSVFLLFRIILQLFLMLNLIHQLTSVHILHVHQPLLLLLLNLSQSLLSFSNWLFHKLVLHLISQWVWIHVLVS